jgi:RNA polymerase sigma factor (sigma-70 family)
MDQSGHPMNAGGQAVHEGSPARDSDGGTDAELLRRFAHEEDPRAMTAIVGRHGPLVMGLCRSMLRNEQDAEDAFQATFLVLLKKARSIGKPTSLASWLHGVACRVALRARSQSMRRRQHENSGSDMTQHAHSAEPPAEDSVGLVHEELCQLPERFRLPLIFCCLEGESREAAARRLGWTLGSLKGRLERGREMLRARLARRGLVLSAAALAGLLAQAAMAEVPAALVTSTVQATLLAATGQSVLAGATSARVAQLTRDVLSAMLLAKMKSAGLILLAGGLAALVAATVFVRSSHPGDREVSSDTQATPGREPDEIREPVRLTQAAPPPAPKKRDDDERRETERLIQAELPRWTVRMGDDADLKVSPKPVLRWTNPASGRMHGEIYVWTADGRPEAVMSLFKVWEPDWGFAGEFHSLSQTKLVAKRDKAVFWNCERPGIAFRDVPDASSVAESASRRLQQMRALANNFSAVLVDSRRNVKGERQTLRLLTQPLYRYSGRGDVADGALFAFVLGTDVEVLLLIEARRTETANRWKYALARLNNDELAAFFKEEEVWRVPPIKLETRDAAYIYMSLTESPPSE